jgi:hypothetical protein
MTLNTKPQGRMARSGIVCGLGTVSAFCGAMAGAETPLDGQTVSAFSDSGSSLDEVTVTAKRLELLGVARTASEGVVTDEELQLTPAYRPGQLLETVPGLIVTLHSGEGKANQYLLRGYNLDHGTDLATFVDGMPINQPTHAHGQGYTDLNFMIPELADTLTYTKGPYYPSVGDFGAVGSVRVGYRDTIEDQVSATIGTLGFQRVFGVGAQQHGAGTLLGPPPPGAGAPGGAPPRFSTTMAPSTRPTTRARRTRCCVTARALKPTVIR